MSRFLFGYKAKIHFIKQKAKIFSKSPQPFKSLTFVLNTIPNKNQHINYDR